MTGGGLGEVMAAGVQRVPRAPAGRRSLRHPPRRRAPPRTRGRPRRRDGIGHGRNCCSRGVWRRRAPRLGGLRHARSRRPAPSRSRSAGRSSLGQLVWTSRNAARADADRGCRACAGGSRIGLSRARPGGGEPGSWVAADLHQRHQAASGCAPPRRRRSARHGSFSSRFHSSVGASSATVATMRPSAPAGSSSSGSGRGASMNRTPRCALRPASSVTGFREPRSSVSRCRCTTRSRIASRTARRRVRRASCSVGSQPDWPRRVPPRPHRQLSASRSGSMPVSKFSASTKTGDEIDSGAVSLEHCSCAQVKLGPRIVR